MMMIEYHPAVQRDFNDAIAWYDAEGGFNLGDRFEAEFRACVAAIRMAPRRFPFFQNSDVFRRAQLPHFPWVIVYRIKSDIVRIVILRHSRRHPHFGMRRW
ncbi:MAG: type II toxin-antitoxin system RelE/ParE family toxin [Opitutaceae bacterium]|jgi:plasmid stabilization system protein ParE|nr:type II toxin-antitoxin system RelE/ParE family toxin [Opitutaceae bacterium]